MNNRHKQQAFTNSFDMDEEKNLSFEMQEEKFPFELERRTSGSSSDRKSNQYFDYAAPPTSQGYKESQDEYLTFLNFNIATPAPTPKYDFQQFEIHNQYEEESAIFHNHHCSSDEDIANKKRRSRSHEKVKTNSGKVSGDDLRRLFEQDYPEKFRRKEPSSSEFHQIDTSKKSHNGILQPSSQNGEICCSCPKSKCKKMYCTCYSKGKRCSSKCTCRNCGNVKKSKNSSESSDTEQPRKREEGCSCRMSYCEKSYCSCAKEQKGCSAKCACYNCKNSYGTRKKHF